ncbi:MAG: 3-hydroxyacyl-CoA dehydrogenase family protein [Planctomycetota bacterium]|nr:MAG: 3-hydroxyacyl-CoA dehydrogenase family protein [Planctomycetota bacterium]
MADAADVERAAVLGAGTMGHGIAQVCAQAGIDVVLYDVDDAALQRGLAGIKKSLEKAVEKGKARRDEAEAALRRVTVLKDLDAACRRADVVVEAVPEKLELKRKLFAEVERHVAPEAMLASNTSSLSIERLAEGLARPERFLGLHFFNPVPLMPLLEIVVGPRTGAGVVVAAAALGRRLGKEPIVVQDAPGFASSRLGLALGLEAIRMVEEGVASATDIDKAMELGYRHPMGPLKLTDLVGLDVRLGIAEYLHQTLGERFRPPELLRRMVGEGKLGKKSGQGFYEWTE